MKGFIFAFLFALFTLGCKDSSSPDGGHSPDQLGKVEEEAEIKGIPDDFGKPSVYCKALDQVDGRLYHGYTQRKRTVFEDLFLARTSYTGTEQVTEIGDKEFFTSTTINGQYRGVAIIGMKFKSKKFYTGDSFYPWDSQITEIEGVPKSDVFGYLVSCRYDYENIENETEQSHYPDFSLIKNSEYKYYKGTYIGNSGRRVEAIKVISEVLFKKVSCNLYKPGDEPDEDEFEKEGGYIQKFKPIDSLKENLPESSSKNKTDFLAEPVNSWSYENVTLINEEIMTKDRPSLSQNCSPESVYFKLQLKTVEGEQLEKIISESLF